MNWLIKIANANVPAEPGTVPVPEDHVRLFHYFPPEEVENIKTYGIDIQQAKGDTYGEPNTVWSSSMQPSSQKSFVEFSVSRNDPRLQLGRPSDSDSIEEIRKRQWDMTFNQTIKPEEFIAIHEPWHGKYRYIMNDPELTEQVKRGEFDYLMDEEEYRLAILCIKEGK